MAESERIDENVARGNIEDIGAAAEAAYAEKPFRDAEVDYREQLSDEARQALDFIASQEGEKALAQYEATKSPEDPVVRVLREKAMATLKIPESRVEAVRGMKMGAVDGAEWVERVQWGVREFGRDVIEEILTSDRSNQEKQKLLSGVSQHLGYGLNHVIENWKNQQGRRERWHGTDGKLTDQAKDSNLLLTSWGAIIGDVMAGEGVHEYVANGMLHAKQEGTEKVIDSKIDFYMKARLSFPAVSSGLDKSLERYGWIWDDNQKKYIKL